MKSLTVSLGASFAMSLAGAGMAQVPPLSHAALHAPRITCSMTMQFWCIVQSDATVKMVTKRNERIWSIVTTGGKRPSVIVRENTACDSPADYHPARIQDQVTIQPGQRRRRIVTLMLNADRSCTVRISYPIGNDDWARESERMAKYGLLVCEQRSCRGSLLDIH